VERGVGDGRAADGVGSQPIRGQFYEGIEWIELRGAGTTEGLDEEAEAERRQRLSDRC